MSLQSSFLAFCAAHTWDEGDGVLAAELGRLEDVGVGGGVAWIAGQLERSLMQAEGMCRGVLRAAIEGFATEERRRACARVVSAVGCRGSGQDGGVVITEAAREEGLHSMVGYVREGVRVDMDSEDGQQQQARVAASFNTGAKKPAAKVGIGRKGGSSSSRPHLFTPACICICRYALHICLITTTSLHFIPSPPIYPTPVLTLRQHSADS